jgi:hypothetical protein
MLLRRSELFNAFYYNLCCLYLFAALKVKSKSCDKKIRKGFHFYIFVVNLHKFKPNF